MVREYPKLSPGPPSPVLSLEPPQQEVRALLVEGKLGASVIIPPISRCCEALLGGIPPTPSPVQSRRKWQLTASVIIPPNSRCCEALLGGISPTPSPVQSRRKWQLTASLIIPPNSRSCEALLGVIPPTPSPVQSRRKWQLTPWLCSSLGSVTRSLEATLICPCLHLQITVPSVTREIPVLVNTVRVKKVHLRRE